MTEQILVISAKKKDTVSKRQQIIHDFGVFFRTHNLDQVYGCIEGLESFKTRPGKYRTLTFCKARNLDGILKVFSENSLRVEFQTRYQSLPHQGSETFTSGED